MNMESSSRGLIIPPGDFLLVDVAGIVILIPWLSFLQHHRARKILQRRGGCEESTKLAGVHVMLVEKETDGEQG